MNSTLNKYLMPLVMLVFLSMVFTSCNQSKNGTEEAVAVLDSALIIPAFDLISIYDSARIKRENIEQDGLVLIKYFSPDCDHCQHEAREYLSKKDSLKNIKTLWVAGNWNTLEMVEGFYEEYQLAQLSPMAVGMERDNELLVHYKFRGVPFSAVYKDNQFIKSYTGDIDFKELIAINDGTYVPIVADSTDLQ